MNLINIYLSKVRDGEKFEGNKEINKEILQRGFSKFMMNFKEVSEPQAALYRFEQKRLNLTKGQIFSTKNLYYDAFGNLIECIEPYYVLTSSNIFSFGGEEFIRVFPISPFTEMASEKDKIVEDLQFIGFPFLIEYWNEQPISTLILDDFISQINEDSIKTVEQTKTDKKELELFRELEIENTIYLRNSVNSFIHMFEKFDNIDDNIAVIDLDGKLIELETERSSNLDWAKAARMHFNNSKYYSFQVGNFLANIIEGADSFELTLQEFNGIISLKKYCKADEEPIIHENGNYIFKNLINGFYILEIDGNIYLIKLRTKNNARI